jgi:hypothetical protein
MPNERNGDIVYEITEHIGIIKAFKNGWSKELNLVSWNNTDPKYDIREWDEDHKSMSKGITLKPEEMRKIVDLLRDRQI